MKKGSRIALILCAGILLLAGAALWLDNYIYWKRPSSVPVSAVKQVGVGWNYWIDCKPATNADPNLCTIYQPRTGEVLRRQAFVLRDQGRGASKAELNVESWNGTYIQLRNGARLYPSGEEFR